MNRIDEKMPTRPRGAAAPDTHPLELQRLALQERSHPGCRPLAVQTVIWLFRAYNAAVTAQADELRHLGLSPSAFNVLMTLLNTPGTILEPWQLADQLLISRPSITGLLDTLQGKGLIVRRPHDRDRRRVIIELTWEGRTLLHNHFPTYYAGIETLVQDLTEDEMATLVGLLRRLHGAAPPHLTDNPA